ncbi:hypothetical protein ACLB2K_024058 [Fragaria x ananassa]
MGSIFSYHDSRPSVKNILLMDSEGKRVAVKYYSDDWPTNGAKLVFEKSVFTKTLKTNARIESEIMMFESNVVVYRFMQDLHFFVTGSDDENELILVTVLQGFFDAVALLLRNNVDKREALENLDLILLCFDEIVDGGCAIRFLILVLSSNPTIIAGKVATHTMDADAPLAEQYVSGADFRTGFSYGFPLFLHHSSAGDAVSSPRCDPRPPRRCWNEEEGRRDRDRRSTMIGREVLSEIAAQTSDRDLSGLLLRFNTVGGGLGSRWGEKTALPALEWWRNGGNLHGTCELLDWLCRSKDVTHGGIGLEGH